MWKEPTIKLQFYIPIHRQDLRSLETTEGTEHQVVDLSTLMRLLATIYDQHNNLLCCGYTLTFREPG